MGRLKKLWEERQKIESGENKIRVTVYLSQKVWDIAEEQAKAKNTSRSGLIEKLIKESKPKPTPKYELVTLKEIDHLFW